MASHKQETKSKSYDSINRKILFCILKIQLLTHAVPKISTSYANNANSDTCVVYLKIEPFCNILSSAEKKICMQEELLCFKKQEKKSETAMHDTFCMNCLKGFLQVEVNRNKI